MFSNYQKSIPNAYLFHVFVSDTQDIRIVSVIVPVISHMIKPVAHYIYNMVNVMYTNIINDFCDSKTFSSIIFIDVIVAIS